MQNIALDLIQRNEAAVSEGIHQDSRTVSKAMAIVANARALQQVRKIIIYKTIQMQYLLVQSLSVVIGLKVLRVDAFALLGL